MSEQIHLIAIRWVATSADPDAIDRVLDSFAVDWLRYNNTTWFVASNMDSHVVATRVQSVLVTEDSVLAVPIDVSRLPLYGGWAPNMVWDWFRKHRGFQNALAGR